MRRFLSRVSFSSDVALCVRTCAPVAYSYLAMSIGPSCVISHPSLPHELQPISHVAILTSLGGVSCACRSCAWYWVSFGCAFTGLFFPGGAGGGDALSLLQLSAISWMAFSISRRCFLSVPASFSFSLFFCSIRFCSFASFSRCCFGSLA